MVSTTTTMVSHAQEGDKKRKQTMERAKANHLCRQLQMRLQYARLKVEHGWQKQTLNEVENLYFHHSHQRGPKPFPSSLVATTTQPEPTAFAPSSGPHSSLSFISRNTGSIAAAAGAASNGRDTTPQPGNRSGSPTRSASVTPKPTTNDSSMPPPSTTPTPMAIDKGNHPSSTRYAVPLTPTSPQRGPLLLNSMQGIGASASPVPQLPYSGYASGAVASSSTTPRASTSSSSMGDKSLPPPPLPASLRSPSSPSKSRSRGGKSKASNGNGASSSSQQKNGSASTSTSGASTSSTGYAPSKDSTGLFSFGSNSSSSGTGLMTYDAFWSNHATTAAISPRNAASTVGLQSRTINGLGGLGGGGMGVGLAGGATAAAGSGSSSEVGQQT